MVVTGNGESGFDSGEGAWETATTSTEGSRRANYPIQKLGGSEVTYLEVGVIHSPFNNENNLNPLSRNNWRASLVPAAAVIPAPIAYIKVVAVKKLVVEVGGVGGCSREPRTSTCLSVLGNQVVWGAILTLLPIFYFEKIRVFKAGKQTLALNTFSMG